MCIEFSILVGNSRLSKKKNELFRGIQIVASGKFFQLPQVALHPLHGNNGDFCFLSNKWNVCFPYHFEFDTIHRQADKPLIDIVKETATGSVREESELFLKTLGRPLLDPIHMFSSKYLAFLYNSERLEHSYGDQMTNFAVDQSEPGKKCFKPHLNKKHTSNKIKRHTNKHPGKPIYFPCSKKQSPDQTKSRAHQIIFR